MFCRKCGTQIPDDSVFCTKCGTPVQSVTLPGGVTPVQAAAGTEYIEAFQGVVAKDQFDLYVADTRFVMIKVQSGSSGVGSMLGPVGTIMEMGVNRARKKKYEDDLTLDQKLRRDKASFQMEYNVVDHVKLGKGKLGGRILQVRYADEKGSFRKLDITVNADQYDKLAKLLPAVPGIAAKFQLKS